MYYPAHLYYKGNSEKRLENKTLDEAEQFSCARETTLGFTQIDPQTRKSRSGVHDVIQKQAFLEKCTVGDGALRFSWMKRRPDTMSNTVDVHATRHKKTTLAVRYSS